MIKNKDTFNMLRTEGIIKVTYKPIANIIFDNQRLASRTRQRCPFLPPVFNIELELQAKAIKQDK